MAVKNKKPKGKTSELFTTSIDSKILKKFRIKVKKSKGRINKTIEGYMLAEINK